MASGNFGSALKSIDGVVGSNESSSSNLDSFFMTVKRDDPSKFEFCPYFSSLEKFIKSRDSIRNYHAWLLPNYSNATIISNAWYDGKNLYSSEEDYFSKQNGLEVSHPWYLRKIEGPLKQVALGLKKSANTPTIISRLTVKPYKRKDKQYNTVFEIVD